MTPHIFLEPNGGGYTIGRGEQPTNLPDGYAQIVIVGKYGDSTSASLTTFELAQLAEQINLLIG